MPMQFQQLSNRNSNHYDVVICTVPWVDSSIPLMAPAALKRIVESTGKTCLAIDINIEILSYTEQHPNKDKFVKFFFEEKLEPEVALEINDMLDSLAEQLLSFDPEYVGLSLFSYLCQPAAKWMAYHIRKRNPDVKIIIGGPGCLPTVTGPSVFVKKLIDSKLIDYHIRGDGEISLAELLKGNDKYPGINDIVWQELSNQELEQLPMPDYTDYNFSLYPQQLLPIIGSRGCVRQCTFCDYITNWTKFRWRSADSIFSEMLTQFEKYNIRQFKFQDSLTNGNLKEFSKLTQLLATHNEQHPESSFVWGGFYIFREWTSNSEQEWEMLSRSGAQILSVGIENFNQHIRYAIGKKISDESIIKHIEQAQKYQITCVLLHITGYINETQQDINNVKQWLRDNVRFKDIIEFHWGTGLGIFENTYLGNNKDKLGITMLSDKPHEWISTQTDSTHEDRARWSVEYITLSKELGYTVLPSAHDNHYLLENAFITK